MSPPVSRRADGAVPSLDELAVAQGAAPARSGSGARTQSSSERNTVSQAPASASRANAPREVSVGRLDYYRQRDQDFRARNPGQQPPPYYLEYGDKYVRAFSALGPQQLSREGLEWRDRALKQLQVEMETARTRDGVAFAELERHPQDFKTFAYKTHVKAYLDAGLLSLPTQDLVTILGTPDLADLLDKDGLAQILTVVKEVRSQDVAAIVGATVSEAQRALQDRADGMEREVRSFVQQRWWDGGRH